MVKLNVRIPAKAQRVSLPRKASLSNQAMLDYRWWSIFTKILVLAAGDNDYISKITSLQVDIVNTQTPVDKKQNAIYWDSLSKHFICKKQGSLLNSYTLFQQTPNASGFCQTFAVMNYMGIPLAHKEYPSNNKRALNYLASQIHHLWPVFKKHNIHVKKNGTRHEIMEDVNEESLLLKYLLMFIDYEALESVINNAKFDIFTDDDF